MKRIKYACLEQTIHFQLKDDLPAAAAGTAVKDELAQFKALLDRKHTKYKIISEDTRPDGSVILRLKRQYNSYDVGDYLA